MSAGYGMGLFAQHAELLAASAIPSEQARTRGYVSVDTKARLDGYGFSPAQQLVPGLLIPLHDATGKCTGFQYRPDEPRRTSSGRVIKYETPPGQANRLDVPPGVGPSLGNPAVDLWVTEGARKADAAAAVGLACVSLSGVWNWRATNSSGGKVALPDWQDVALNGRRVVLAFDSDAASNPKVAHALNALADYLSSKGARVAVLQLPPGEDGKTGLDDYIAAGHTRDDLEQLVADTSRTTHANDKESASTALVRLALNGYRLGLSADDEPFAVPLSGPPIVRALRGGKGSLRATLADTYYTSTGKVAPSQALTEALLTLEGRAQQQDAERLHLRVALVDGVTWLDLGDATGRAVAIDATGWRVAAAVPVLFRRTQLTGTLPTPQAGGSLDELWTLLNVTDAARPLVLAWLVAALLPDVPHPVLTLRGEQGSGKSTATRTLAALLDPSPAQVRKPPRDVDGWVTAASGSWVVGVDNVSTVSEWWSDALCRAVTGDGDVRRRLYSDADLAVFSFRRVVLLNGIDLGAVRDDLAERLLTVDLARIGETGRQLDADLTARWQDAHPRILGALLDLAAQVLGVLPRLNLERLPRMADFAKVLAAVDVVLGTKSLKAYVGQAGDLAADAVDSDPVLAAIKRTITAPWEGVAAQLLERLSGVDDTRRAPKDWPKDARALTGLLRRRAPSLRRLGWVVDDLGRGGHDKLIRFQLTPPTADDDAGDDAGDNSPMRATTPTVWASPAPVARTAAGLSPAETPSEGRNAGDAGDGTPQIFPRVVEQVEGLPAGSPDADPMPERAYLSPATPASPANGPCALCGAAITRYGLTASGSLCPTCTPATNSQRVIA